MAGAERGTANHLAGILRRTGAAGALRSADSIHIQPPRPFTGKAQQERGDGWLGLRGGCPAAACSLSGL